MSIINLIKAAILSVKTHKLRVFLTMIGIIIGISSVITILAIGAGLKAEVARSASDTSANKVSVYFESEDKNMGNENLNGGLQEPFNKEDCVELKKIHGIEKVEPNQGFLGSNSITANASYFDKNTSVFLSIYDNKNLNIAHGRAFNKNDSNTNYIILSDNDAKSFFNSAKEAIGHGININGVTFEVIGVLKPVDKFSFDIGSNLSVIQNNSTKEITSEMPFNSINVYVSVNENKDKILEDVKEQLKSLHPELKGKYKIQDPQEITKAFEKIIGGITLFITFVTGISLFVGGIGVMNIMYVSVTERRREIGIRRAIGAKPKSILLQFLFEAIIVTGIGGIVGILIGYLLSKVIGVFLPFKPVLTVGSFVGATLTSVITGIIFGIMPAYKASKLDPIKAIYK